MQAMPVGVVAGQTGNFQDQHDAHMGEGHLAGQTREAGTLIGAGTGQSQIFVDEDHLLARPTELTGAFGQGVLAGGGLPVMFDLGGRRLAQVDEGGALQMRRLDFGQIIHGLPPGVDELGRLGSTGAPEFRRPSVWVRRRVAPTGGSPEVVCR
jgi:hypothetical protein